MPAGGAGGVRNTSSGTRESAGSVAATGGSNVGSARSGAGGAGGVRNSSSGTRESAGSQARSSGGSTGNTSRGGVMGSSMGGGLASAAGGMGSNGGGARSDRAGAFNGGFGTAANGLQSAGRAAYGGNGRNSGGLLGGVGNVGAFGSNFRGPLGPNGELRTGVTPETRNYQNAEIARAAYPDSFGRYSQKQVTDFMDTLASVAPPEAFTARHGTSPLGSISRVALNQVLGGVKWSDKYHDSRRLPGDLAGTTLGAALANLDSLEARSGTRGLRTQGLAAPGTGLHTSAQAAIGDAMMGRGLRGNSLNASNFTATGTNLKGTTPIGSYAGTTYRSDPAFAGRIAAANTKAAGIMGGAIPSTQASAPSSAFASADPAPSQPWERAQPIPSPMEHPGYRSNLASNFPGRPKEVGGAFPAARATATSNFPGRPMEMAGAFPAAQPTSSFPGRPMEMAGGFPPEDRSPSQFPARPAPEQSFNSAVAARPNMSPGFASNFAARPEYPGSLPGAGQSFASMVATRPEFGGAFPSAPATGNFPGRPMDMAGGFPAAQSTNNFPGRPMELAGGFPAASTKYQDRLPQKPIQDRMPTGEWASAAPQRTINPRMADMMATAAALPEKAPQQVAAANPEDFAASPLGRAFGQIGQSVRTGIGALNDGMRQYNENKGLIGLANAVGVNPIGKAVKSSLSGLMRGGNGMASYGPTEFAASGSSNPGLNIAPSPKSRGDNNAQSLIGMLREISRNGGPKNPQEQAIVRRLARTTGLPALNYRFLEPA